MSGWPRRIAVWLLLGCVGFACGGDEQQEPEPATGTGSSTQAAPPSWFEPASAAPLLSLSLNDAAELTLHRGWPLIVRASLLHPAAFESAGAPAEPVLVAVAGSALRVRITDQTGAAQSWPLHAAAPTPDELRIEQDGSADALWWLDGAETAALADGRYTLVAELDTAGAATGWKGAATSSPSFLTLTPEPSPLPAERERAKRLSILALLLLRGENTAARAELDALLREDPDDLVALEVSGDLLAAEGRTAEARDAYSRALDVFFERDPKPPEPPLELLRKRQAVMQDVVVPE